MASRTVRNPGSRLGDDLYRMYLIALGWFVFPIYGAAFAEVLPTSQTTMRWVYPVAAVFVSIGWLWSGSRGGPMMVSRASLVHELGAPVSARTVLAPQLLRQALGWAAGGAAVGGVLTSIGGDYSYSTAFAVSGAGFLLCFAAVAWACVVMVAVRQTSRLRVGYLVAAVAAAIIVAAAVLWAKTVTTSPVLAVLAVAALSGGAVALHALGSVPVQSLWERARNLESARSALMEVDFHRMMTDLRGAGDNRAAGRTRLPGRSWVWLWRCLAPIRHSMPWSGLRLGASLLAGALLLALAPIGQGVVLLTLGAIWLMVGFELTRGLAAVAEQVTFLVHYPRSSFPLLAGQLVASFGLGAGLIALTTGWRFGIDQNEAWAATVVSAMGIVGGAMQARLGAPDMTSLVGKYGLQNAAAMLWARAATAPMVVLTTAILVFHGYRLQDVDYGFAFDIASAARTFILVLVVLSLVVCLRPLRKVVR